VILGLLLHVWFGSALVADAGARDAVAASVVADGLGGGYDVAALLRCRVLFWVCCCVGFGVPVVGGLVFLCLVGIVRSVCCVGSVLRSGVVVAFLTCSLVFRSGAGGVWGVLCLALSGRAPAAVGVVWVYGVVVVFVRRGCVVGWGWGWVVGGGWLVFLGLVWVFCGILCLLLVGVVPFVPLVLFVCYRVVFALLGRIWCGRSGSFV